jgi:hypothetical protein
LPALERRYREPLVDGTAPLFPDNAALPRIPFRAFEKEVISSMRPDYSARPNWRAANQGVTMLRPAMALVSLFVACFAGPGFARAGADDLVGQWTVTWSNTSKNPMTLANKSGRLSGTYENEDNDSCSLTGNFLTSNQHVALQIVCPKWDIRMQGVASKDNKTIRGSFQANVDSIGKFVMTKR